jgi:flavin reductase (DIM6/NTAB) family NADH-FMN oxidoreductase RutF
MTVGSFTSISLDPPLVGFFATTTSQSLSQILQAGQFAANVLADSQSAMSKAFASHRGRFDAVSWHLSANGMPHLAGALAWVDCTVQSAIEMGDHTAVVAAVNSRKSSSKAPPARLLPRCLLPSGPPVAAPPRGLATRSLRRMVINAHLPPTRPVITSAAVHAENNGPVNTRAWSARQLRPGASFRQVPV